MFRASYNIPQDNVIQKSLSKRINLNKVKQFKTLRCEYLSIKFLNKTVSNEKDCLKIHLILAKENIKTLKLSPCTKKKDKEQQIRQFYYLYTFR